MSNQNATLTPTTGAGIKELGETLRNKTLKLNLWQALAKVQAELEAVPKEGKAPTNIGGYDYRKFDDLLAAYHRAAVNAGILCIPHDLNVEWDTHKGDRRVYWVCIVEIEWQFIHVKTGETTSVKTKGWAQDIGDKALPKARTSAHKELISRMFSIPFDNPDIDGSDAVDRGPESGSPPISPAHPKKSGGEGSRWSPHPPAPDKPEQITPDNVTKIMRLRSKLSNDLRDELKTIVQTQYGVMAPSELTDIEAVELIKVIEDMIAGVYPFEPPEPEPEPEPE